MHNTSSGHWTRWRIAGMATPPVEPVVAPPRFRRQPLTPRDGREPAPSETPGPDGIRHELVERIRREIAAGTYDTEERWLAAESVLLRRIENG